jgi:hypothetical protein
MRAGQRGAAGAPAAPAASSRHPCVCVCESGAGRGAPGGQPARVGDGLARGVALTVHRCAPLSHQNPHPNACMKLQARRRRLPLHSVTRRCRRRQQAPDSPCNISAGTATLSKLPPCVTGSLGLAARCERLCVVQRFTDGRRLVPPPSAPCLAPCHGSLQPRSYERTSVTTLKIAPPAVRFSLTLYSSPPHIAPPPRPPSTTSTMLAARTSVAPRAFGRAAAASRRPTLRCTALLGGLFATKPASGEDTGFYGFTAKVPLHSCRKHDLDMRARRAERGGSHWPRAKPPERARAPARCLVLPAPAATPATPTPPPMPPAGYRRQEREDVQLQGQGERRRQELRLPGLDASGAFPCPPTAAPSPHKPAAGALTPPRRSHAITPPPPPLSPWPAPPLAPGGAGREHCVRLRLHPAVRRAAGEPLPTSLFLAIAARPRKAVRPARAGPAARGGALLLKPRHTARGLPHS